MSGGLGGVGLDGAGSELEGASAWQADGKSPAGTGAARDELRDSCRGKTQGW